MIQDGHHVEQALAGMLMGPVPSVDDRGLDILGKKIGGSGTGVAQDDDIWFHRLDVFGGVDQGLPLDRRAARSRDVEGVGAHPFGRYLKGETGPCRGLEKEVDDGLTAQGRNLFDGSFRNLTKGTGGCENQLNIGDGKLLDTKQVVMAKLMILRVVIHHRIRLITQ